MADFQEICKRNLQVDSIKRIRVFQKRAVLQSTGQFQTNNHATTTLSIYEWWVLCSALYTMRYGNCPSVLVETLLPLSLYFKDEFEVRY